MKRSISNCHHDELICALSDDQHYVQQPIVLPDCGHSACHACLPNSINNQEKCKFCNESIKRDLRNDKVSVVIKKFIQHSISDLLKNIEKQTDEKINQLKTMLTEKKLNIEDEIKIVENEIGKRISSIKKKLDKYHNSLKIELSSIKTDIIKTQQRENNQIKNELKQFDKSLKKMKKDINNKNHKEDLLYEYQDNLKKLNESIQNFDKKKYKFQYEIPKEELNIDNVCGHLYYISDESICLRSKIIKALEENEYEKFEFKYAPADIYRLENNNIISVNPNDLNIVLYDSQFNVINIVEKINDKPIQSSSLTSDDDGRVFISDSLNHRIIIMDYELNLIKTFGSEGTNFDQFKSPLGIYWNYYNNQLYVCDRDNKRILIFDNNLKFLKSIPLDYYPDSLSISNRYCYIASSIKSKNIVYVYDETDWSFKSNFNDGKCWFSQIDMFLYQITENFSLYVFENYSYIETRIERLKNVIPSFSKGNHVKIFLNEKLYLYGFSRQCIRFNL